MPPWPRFLPHACQRAHSHQSASPPDTKLWAQPWQRLPCLRPRTCGHITILSWLLTILQHQTKRSSQVRSCRPTASRSSKHKQQQSAAQQQQRELGACVLRGLPAGLDALELVAGRRATPSRCWTTAGSQLLSVGAAGQSNPTPSRQASKPRVGLGGMREAKKHCFGRRSSEEHLQTLRGATDNALKIL